MVKVFGLLVIAVLIAAGCGESESSDSLPEEIDRAVETVGLELFEERVIGASPGCVTCHSMEEGVVLVGPSMFGLADRAGSQVPDLTAGEYVRQSIVEPNAFVVSGYSSGQMIGDFAETLSDEQVASLVELLLAE